MNHISKSDNAMLNHSMQKKIASLVDYIRLRNFPNVLAEFLSSLCQFDSLIMAAYKESFKPVIVFPLDPASHSQTLKLYLEKGYILDPLYTVSTSDNPSQVCRLKDIAPDCFESTEYFQSCYRAFNFVDEISLIIKLDNQVGFTISMGRSASQGSITRIELNRLNDMFPLIKSLVRQFWLSQSQEFVQYDKSGGEKELALSTFGSGILTRREQEIAVLILQGHSSRAIAGKLDISVGTVKVHRKKIHVRLNTTSVADIFTRFLLHLGELESAAANGGQPLTERIECVGLRH